MKVISLWQPWASLIVHGLKSIETRGYPTNVRGRVAIHATKSEGAGDRSWIIQDEHFVEAFRAINQRTSPPQTSSGKLYDALPRGAIIGTAELYDCVRVETLYEILPAGLKFNISNEEYAFGNYEPGRFGWLLRDPLLFKTPIAAKGKQGWWEYDLRLCRTCGQLAEPGIAHCTECQFSAVGCL